MLFRLRFDSSECTIFGIEAKIDGKKFQGKCLKKDAAIQKYDDTIAKGGGAYLLEQNRMSTCPRVIFAEENKSLSDLFIGNLPPKKCCEIGVHYLSTLKADLKTDSLTISIPFTGISSESKDSFKMEAEVKFHAH